MRSVESSEPSSWAFTLHKVSNPALMPFELLPERRTAFVVKLIRETAVRGHRCEMVFYIPSERGPSPTGIIREVCA